MSMMLFLSHGGEIMEKAQVIALRDAFMSILRYSESLKKNIAEPLCIRLDNDVILSGAHKHFIWDDDNEILFYYSTNEKGTGFEPAGTGRKVYAGMLSASNYDNIQEMWTQLTEESFGQSLAVLKAKFPSAHGVGDGAKVIPIDDSIGGLIKAALFDPLDVNKHSAYRNNYAKTKKPSELPLGMVSEELKK